MSGYCVPDRSEEGSRKTSFRLANSSTFRGQGICIMPFQNAESQTHRRQDGWCFMSWKRKVFVDLFVFLHGAPNNINLTQILPIISVLQPTFVPPCVYSSMLWSSFSILFMSGSFSVEKFWGQTANFFRKQQRKVGWKVWPSIIQAACLLGPVGCAYVRCVWVKMC